MRRSARNRGEYYSGGCYCLLVLRAGMMASRLYHRRRVIPALTDHLVGRGEVIGLSNILSLCGSRQSAT
jgi:hypothetical protein